MKKSLYLLSGGLMIFCFVFFVPFSAKAETNTIYSNTNDGVNGIHYATTNNWGVFRNYTPNYSITATSGTMVMISNLGPVFGDIYYWYLWSDLPFNIDLTDLESVDQAQFCIFDMYEHQVSGVPPEGVKANYKGTNNLQLAIYNGSEILSNTVNYNDIVNGYNCFSLNSAGLDYIKNNNNGSINLALHFTAYFTDTAPIIEKGMWTFHALTLVSSEYPTDKPRLTINYTKTEAPPTGASADMIKILNSAGNSSLSIALVSITNFFGFVLMIGFLVLLFKNTNKNIKALTAKLKK